MKFINIYCVKLMLTILPLLHPLQIYIIAFDLSSVYIAIFYNSPFLIKFCKVIF